MAEAAAAPLAIAGVQGGWFVVQKFRHSHPKYRLHKWELKVAKAMEGVQRQSSKIPPVDLKDLLQQHALWETKTCCFRTELKNKQMGLLNWKAWIGQSSKEIWVMAKNVERLAIRTSAAAVRDDLQCFAFHSTDQTERCHLCAVQETASALTSPQSEPRCRPQQEPLTAVCLTHDHDLDSSHPGFYVNVQVGPFSTRPEPGQSPMNLCVEVTRKIDHGPLQCHTPLASPHEILQLSADPSPSSPAGANL